MGHCLWCIRGNKRSEIHVNHLTYCALCNLSWSHANRQSSMHLHVTTDAFMTRANTSQSPVSNADTCGTHEWAHRYTISHSSDVSARSVQCCCVLGQRKLTADWSASAPSSVPCVQQKATGGWISPRLPAGCCLLNGKCYGSARWATNIGIIPECRLLSRTHHTVTSF